MGVLTMAFQLFWTTLAASGDPVYLHELYIQSPDRAHLMLRKRLFMGKDNSKLIDYLISVTGDRSFAGLRKATPKARAAMILLYAAWTRWDQRDYESAVRQYLQAFNLLTGAGSEIEGVFCYYYIAEIFAEQEKYDQSLKWAEKGLNLLIGRRAPYLEGLLSESRGFSLWYLDLIAEGIRAFGVAAHCWEQIAFRSGQINCWNNLASLYQELRLPQQARYCYSNAVAALREETPPEIRYQLYENLALFEDDRDRRERALHYLSVCQLHKSVAPQSYLLTRAKILGVSGPLENLRPRTPSQSVERDLVLGEIRAREGKHESANRLLERALHTARSSGLRYQQRIVSLALGRELEKEGRLVEAQAIYQQMISRLEAAREVDTWFPYSRRRSHYYKGWIRCLVKRGFYRKARLIIHRLARYRLSQAQLLLNKNRESLPPITSLAQIGQVTSDGAPALSRGISRESSQRIALQGGAILELWPDQEEVFAWIDIGHRNLFYSIRTPELSDLVERLVRPLYDADERLPPYPNRRLARSLYKSIFRVFEDELATHRVLVIPHGLLQSLPLELLIDDSGHMLGELFAFSYLPAPFARFRKQQSITNPPLLLMPKEFTKRSGALHEKAFLSKYFPDLKVAGILPARQFNAHWIHLSAHFKLNPRFWAASSILVQHRELNVLDFLRQVGSCELLSVGVCESGNAFSSTSPYWLGFSELMLQGGAQSLLTSRWKLDEATTPIFLAFYRYCRQGFPLDEALWRARRGFIERARRMGQPWLTHPFYWAGVSYVGWPQRTLYDSIDWLPFLGRAATAAAGLLACFVAWACFSRLQNGGRAGTHHEKSNVTAVDSFLEPQLIGNEIDASFLEHLEDDQGPLRIEQRARQNLR